MFFRHIGLSGAVGHSKAMRGSAWSGRELNKKQKGMNYGMEKKDARSNIV